VRIVGNLCVGPGLVLKGAGELADNRQYAIGGPCGAGRVAMSRADRKSQMTPSRRKRSISSAP
jgi:hypothetical protein